MEQKKEEREKLLKEIKEEMKIIQRDLQNFLEGKSDRERRSYVTYEDFLEVMEDLNMESMEYSGPLMFSWHNVPIKLSEDAAIAFLYTVMELWIYSERVSRGRIPDDLMAYITKFEGNLLDYISL